MTNQYMVLSLIRSFDSNNLNDKKFIHLIGSAFYTERFDLNLFYSGQRLSDCKVIIVYVGDDSSFTIKDCSLNIVLCEAGLNEFLDQLTVLESICVHRCHLPAPPPS